jgi:hypothetical protein
VPYTGLARAERCLQNVFEFHLGSATVCMDQDRLRHPGIIGEVLRPSDLLRKVSSGADSPKPEWLTRPHLTRLNRNLRDEHCDEARSQSGQDVVGHDG